MKRLGLALATMGLLCGGAAAHAEEAGRVVLTALGRSANDPFLLAARAAGVTAGGGGTVGGDAEIVLDDAFAARPPDADPEMRGRLQAVLDRGGSVIFLLSGRVGNLKPFEDLMPVTPWAAQAENCRRPGTLAVAPAGSPLADAVGAPGLALPWRFDLHLPYSTLETGEHRYEWERLGKPLLNTDWKVLLAAAEDGRLPILVEGRCGAGRVFVFAGDLYAKELQAQPGYAAFVKALVSHARPLPVPSGPPASAVAALTVAIPPAQPSGDLAVEVGNPSPSEVRAVFACKVRNLTRGLMNSFSTEIAVPAGQTIRVPVPEGDPQRAVAAGGPAADAPSFRRLDVGLAPVDRKSVAVAASGIVDRTPAVTLAVAGEDVRRFPDADGWPAGGCDFLYGSSAPVDRYVYFCGETPKATVRLGNGFHDIAPLAAASDAGWPENPSVQGLNDGCYSHADLRLKLPLYGFWLGRPAAEQHLRLDWPVPVTFARQAIAAQTPYRFWNRTNPPRYAFGAGEAKALVAVDPAVYDLGRRRDDFPRQTASSCSLDISGLDPQPAREPQANGLKTNCAIEEWEVYGWPATPPPPVHGRWKVAVRDLSAGTEQVVCDKEVTLAPVSETELPVEVPSRSRFGEVVVHAEFTPDGGPALARDFPLLFVPKDAPHLTSRNELGEVQTALLCSPGFLAMDDFGLGTHDATQGWGGPDDQTWAWAHDLMEEGPRGGGGAARFFLSPSGISHYTDPWRNFPSGQNVWDWMTDGMLKKFASGPWKGKKSIHIVLSDRWNGINVWGAFAWDDFTRFDEVLRAAGKPGLQGRTRAEIAQEIRTRYSDQFQRYEMNRYADALLESQKRMADAGVRFTVESHGSFPLAGGELGAKLAQTHVAVGTDVFWAMLQEDPYVTLGQRFGLVAANPDLESGSYDQWGWVNASLGNAFWFAPTGDAEPSRRQWYTTYWMGRVTSEGAFQPYTVYGFSTQGGYGAKDTLDDWAQFNRVQSAMVRLRPEKAAGFGVVASWQLQENRMSPDCDTFGFGLYAGKGHEQVDIAFGDVYQRLARGGAPLGFVASTHTLRKWNGTQPLVVVGGFDTDPWEIAQLDRLSKGGAPVFAIGSEGPAGRAEAEALFGVRRTDTGWEAQPGTETVPDGDGKPLAYVRARPGCAPLLFCPARGSALSSPQAAVLAAACLRLAGDPVKVSPGVSVNPFLAQGSLFLLLGNQSDASLPIDVAVRPAWFDPALKGKALRVVDSDRGVVLAAKDDGGILRFQVPCAGNDGRMIQIVAP